jgi:hypothetical protein
MAVFPDNPEYMAVVCKKLLISRCDRFFDLYMSESRDKGKSWSDLRIVDELKRHGAKNTIVPSLSSLAFHKASGKVLALGGECAYDQDGWIDKDYPRSIIYTAMDPETKRWNPTRKLALPESLGAKSIFCCSSQFVEKENGEILLPVQGHFTGRSEPLCSVILKCFFDRDELTCTDHSELISINVERGFFEPSLTYYQGRYLLTLRNDLSGYVSWSKTGRDFVKPERWTFDDGEWLGNYNTQQHWLKLGDKLFLVYTRKGLNNDHVFRHRAPLLIAEVNPGTLTVIRASERVVVPERGARLGNFAVTQLSENEAYVTVAEWMQTLTPDYTNCRVCEKYGSDNSIYLAKITLD